MKRRNNNTGSVSWNSNLNGYYLRLPKSQNNIASYKLKKDDIREEVYETLCTVLELFMKTGKWFDLSGLKIMSNEEINPLEEPEEINLKTNDYDELLKENKELKNKLVLIKGLTM